MGTKIKLLLVVVIVLLSSCVERWVHRNKDKLHPTNQYYIEVFFIDGTETTMTVQSARRPRLDDKSCLIYYPTTNYSPEIIATHVKLIKMLN